MRNNERVKFLCYCAICIAIAFVLGQVRLFRMPQGGSVKACAMLFVSLTGYWFGIGWGAASGAAYGMLDLMADPYVIHPVQFLLDYPLAHMALGALPALVRTRKNGVYAAYLLGVAGRYACALVSGVVFFYELAPDGSPMLLASFVNSVVYNASYIVPEACLTLVLLAIPALRGVVERQKRC